MAEEKKEKKSNQALLIVGVILSMIASVALCFCLLHAQAFFAYRGIETGTDMETVVEIMDAQAEAEFIGDYERVYLELHYPVGVSYYFGFDRGKRLVEKDATVKVAFK